MLIVVSGAAGLIGGELVSQLGTMGHAIIALVHRNPDIVANDGTSVLTVPWAGVLPQPGHVVTLPCALDQAGLGLSAECTALISAHTDLIIHSAALTAFDAPPEAYQAVNVDGTAAMLALAPQAGFLQISTAYVCGEKDGDIEEASRDAAFGFNNGYEQSKAAAEALVRAAGASGRKVAIARPSVVLGAHGCGTIKSFDTFYGVFRLLAQGRISRLPAMPDAVIDFVPIDHVIAGIIDIAHHWQGAIGKTFHLTSGAPISVGDFLKSISGFEQFTPPLFVMPDQFSDDHLPPRERRLYRRAVAQYAGYFARGPRFAVDELYTLSGRRCALMDGAALGRMIDYAIARGFLKAA